VILTSSQFVRGAAWTAKIGFHVWGKESLLWRRDAVERIVAIMSDENRKRPAALIACGRFSIGHPVRT
jgi:hypothetical protein